MFSDKITFARFKENTDMEPKFETLLVSLLDFELFYMKALETADLVVEAVVENMGLKQKLFK